MKNIKVVVSFRQSKNPRYADFWLIRSKYMDGYKEIMTLDECNKNTAFGVKIDISNSQKYATQKIKAISEALGFVAEIIFA